MNTKPTKKQFEDYLRMSNAYSNSQRYIADLQAQLQFLSRSQSVEELENINIKLLDFLYECETFIKNTLSDGKE